MTHRDHALRLLRQDHDLAGLAASLCEFDLHRDAHVQDVRLASGAALAPVAGDATGGTFFVCQGGELLYASSEGQAGLIGDSVDEALEVLIGLVGWQDYTSLDPRAGDAALARTEGDLRGSYGPRDQARGGSTEELCLAAVLVGLHGQEQDHALLRSLREADPAVRDGLGGVPSAPQALRGWAAAVQASSYGDDPADEHQLVWVRLARRQGRSELARAALIRLLDDAGPRDGSLLGLLAGEFERLGDYAQAARAQQLHASLLDDPAARAAALARLAWLQRAATPGRS